MRSPAIYLLAISLLFVAGCNSPKPERNEDQSTNSQKPKDKKRATPPADWIKSELKATKISIYFPSEPKSRDSAPGFMEDELEEKIAMLESRTDGVLRCQVAEYRVKPSLTLPDRGLKKFTDESLKSVVRFQHDDHDYDLEKDPQELLKKMEMGTLAGCPAYFFELEVHDGTFEGCTIYRGGYIVLAWAATNAETSEDAIKKRRLFVECVGAD